MTWTGRLEHGQGRNGGMRFSLSVSHLFPRRQIWDGYVALSRPSRAFVRERGRAANSIDRGRRREFLLVTIGSVPPRPERSKSKAKRSGWMDGWKHHLTAHLSSLARWLPVDDRGGGPRARPAPCARTDHVARVLFTTTSSQPQPSSNFSLFQKKEMGLVE